MLDRVLVTILTVVVLDQQYKSKPIEVANVITYAFAEYDDGTHGFWAAGNAGWFEIGDPVPSFTHIFNSMNEAASMFYMLADKWKRARKSQRNLSAARREKYASLVFKDVCNRTWESLYLLAIC